MADYPVDGRSNARPKKMNEVEFTSRLKEIKRYFCEAEENLKTLAQLSGEYIVPPVNELRYAGRYIFEALDNVGNDKNCEESKRELIRAEEHCMKAVCDTKDATILFYLGEIRAIENKYSFTHITSAIPNYAELRGKAYAAQKTISKYRKKLGPTLNFYKKLGPHINELTKIFETLQGSIPIIEELYYERYKEDQAIRFRYGLGIIIAATSAIAALFKLIMV